jgi:Protein of unknown function (DUF2946)
MSAPTIHRRSEGMVRGFASWLGILAVLVTLIVSSVHHPLPADVRTHARFTAVLDDGETICHAPDPVGKPQPPEGAPSSPYRADCPICWALQHIFTLAPPLGPVLPCPALVALSVSIAHSVLFVTRATTRDAQPRAPPELI